ncbi:MAG: hypothetical protein CVU56_17805 [Deltaproteobacteria bacterium HGW-Deltaproteobacteria-14]|nr:MAG: hypothetical protein CVU56_17805 [Deltaproteobacteria bacterium HGW-Deltaproteobacteria-14]
MYGPQPPATDLGPIPAALTGTQAGRLLRDLLTDPTLPHSAARSVPARGARAATDTAPVVTTARQTAEPAPADPGAPTVEPAWTPEELEAATLAAERRERRIGLALVVGAALLVAAAIALVLVLRVPSPPAAVGPAPSAPALARSPGAPAVVADPADDEPLIIEEPLRVMDGD